MPKTNTRLLEDERYQVYEGITEKRSHRKDATLINTHHSTVSSEVNLPKFVTQEFEASWIQL